MALLRNTPMGGAVGLLVLRQEEAFLPREVVSLISTFTLHVCIHLPLHERLQLICAPSGFFLLCQDVCQRSSRVLLMFEFKQAAIHACRWICLTLCSSPLSSSSEETQSSIYSFYFLQPLHLLCLQCFYVPPFPPTVLLIRKPPLCLHFHPPRCVLPLSRLTD